MREESFLHYIHKFSLEHKLYEAQGQVLVAVSGGEDSMCLLHFFAYALKKSWVSAVRAVYVDHGTRPEEILQEKALIKNSCQSLGIPFSELEVALKYHRDIEHELRKVRRTLLLEHLKKGEKLALGHHLNDSFEWSLRQSLRSSSLDASLGIPVRNGPIIRPFLCVSKKQLQIFSKLRKVHYAEDSSNLSLRFERNFLRQKLISPLSLAFPSYLKHYVQRQIQLLALLKLKRDIILIDRSSEKEHFIQFAESAHLSEKRFFLLSKIKNFSNLDRGKWAGQLSKFLLMIESPHPKGPLNLSGGVFLYSLGKNCVLICKEKSSLSLSQLRKTHIST